MKGNSRYIKSKVLSYHLSEKISGEGVLYIRKSVQKGSHKKEATPTATSSNAVQGGNVEYHSRRFIPPANHYKVSKKTLIKQGERLDLTAHDTIGHPEKYWPITDLNLVMNPFILMKMESVGSYMSVPSPLSIAYADEPSAQINN